MFFNIDTGNGIKVLMKIICPGYQDSFLKSEQCYEMGFTGGGTVVVASDTVFVTLICNRDAVAGLQPYPRPIKSWSGHLYGRVFQGVGKFNLHENGT